MSVSGGRYGKAPHRRQRWRCRPLNGDPEHRFTPVLTRQGHPHGFCLDCSTALEPWEGQAGAHGPRIAAQTATRQPGPSHSTSPVESVLRQIDRRIGDRVGSFTNRARLAKLLQLMTLDLRGQADNRRWADRLRERLYLAGGRPTTHQRTADDPQGTWSLLA